LGVKEKQIMANRSFEILGLLNPFYAIDSELFDFQQIRFSFGKTKEEATGKRKSKVIVQSFS